MVKSRRKRTRKRTEADVLTRARRRCALCFGLFRDSTVKQGQLAHIDRNPSNDSPANLVFLCLPHHDQYDSSTSQSKNVSAAELRTYIVELDRHLRQEKVTPWPDFSQSDVAGVPQKVLFRSSPEAYDRKIAVYRAFREFVLAALRNATVTREELWRFAEATDEALFIIGPEASDYLREVYRKGVKLQYTNDRIAHERLTPRDDYHEIVQENFELLNWFSEHIEAGLTCRVSSDQSLLENGPFGVS